MGSRLVDLSAEIYVGMPVFPGHPQTEITFVDTHESTRSSGKFTENYGYESESIFMSTHGPTHVDSISHVDPTPGSPSIERLPLDWFVTGAICLDMSHIPPRTEMSLQDIKDALEKAGLDLRPGDTVLMHTGHYGRTYGTPDYLTAYPGLSREAAEWIYDQGAVSIGADAPSVDTAVTRNFPVHQVCREKHKLNIENLGDLSEVAGKRFRYIGLPLKIRNGSGSPIRAVAMLEE
ncbi:MAG: cyclase family protein [Chloroflexi bacterium]|nr:cyclase family protein [Chloroflexota bacterium]